MEVRILQNAFKIFKIYLEQLPVKISFNNCFCCFCWLIKALFDTLKLQKNINEKHSKMLLNEAAEEINCQMNSRKSRNFPRNALIAGIFEQFLFRVQLFLDNHLPCLFKVTSLDMCPVLLP